MILQEFLHAILTVVARTNVNANANANATLRRERESISAMETPLTPLQPLRLVVRVPMSQRAAMRTPCRCGRATSRVASGDVPPAPA